MVFKLIGKAIKYIGIPAAFIYLGYTAGMKKGKESCDESLIIQLNNKYIITNPADNNQYMISFEQMKLEPISYSELKKEKQLSNKDSLDNMLKKID